MEINNKNQKISNITWAVFGAAFGSTIGAILGIIAYNNQWLG